MISLDLKTCMEEKISTESPYSIPVLDKDIKDFIKRIPKSPGVYKFLDKFYTPLYIGKAKLLNKRVASYFRKSSRSKKIEKLIEQAVFIEFVLTNTELESLLHEQFLIKELKPKFNVQFKDDKGYPWIKIETKKNFPAAKSFLGKKLENGKFFGPFPNSYAVRDALKLIQKTFKLRNCSDAYFKNRSRPCLQYEIGRCSAPCIGLISKKEYLKEVQSAELLLDGKSEDLINNFYTAMDEFSQNKDYEKAAIYRDRISALRDIQRSQSIAGFNGSRDAIYVSFKSNKVKVGVTSVNQGWVTGHKNFSQSDGFEDQNILGNFITQTYLINKECPNFLVINQKLENKALLEEALSAKFSRKISIITRPGKKDKGLLDACKANTEYVLRKNNFDQDIKTKFQALKEGLKFNSDLNLIESYESFSRKDAIIMADRKIGYLEQEIVNTKLIEVKSALFNLIERESKAKMIANTADSLKLKVIDPAYEPEIRSWPARKFITILGALLGFMASFIFVLVKFLFFREVSSTT